MSKKSQEFPVVWKHYLQEKHISSFNQKVSACLQEPQGTVRAGGVGESWRQSGKQDLGKPCGLYCPCPPGSHISWAKRFDYTCTELEKAGRKLTSPPSFKCLRYAEIRGWVRGDLMLVRHQGFPVFDHLQFKYLYLSPLYRCRNRPGDKEQPTHPLQS